MIAFDTLKTYEALLESFTPAQAEALVDVMKVIYGRQADRVSCVSNVDPCTFVGHDESGRHSQVIWMGSAMIVNAVGTAALTGWLLLR